MVAGDVFDNLLNAPLSSFVMRFLGCGSILTECFMRLLELFLQLEAFVWGTQGDCTGLFPVPAGSSGFLKIFLQRMGHVEMNDQTDIRLVNTHSEGIGRHHYAADASLPAGLSGCFFFPCQSGMETFRCDVVMLQEKRRFLRLFPVAGIDDGCPGHAVQPTYQSPPLVFRLINNVGQVGTEETGL